MFYLWGFANLYNVTPGFVYPIFRKIDDNNKGGYFISDGQSYRINSFREVVLPDKLKIYKYFVHQIKVEIGSENIYGFVGNNKLIAGTFNTILPYLNNIIGKTNDQLLKKEIKLFIDNIQRAKIQDNFDNIMATLDEMKKESLNIVIVKQNEIIVDKKSYIKERKVTNKIKLLTNTLQKKYKVTVKP